MPEVTTIAEADWEWTKHQAIRPLPIRLTSRIVVTRSRLWLPAGGGGHLITFTERSGWLSTEETSREVFGKPSAGWIDLQTYEPYLPSKKFQDGIHRLICLQSQIVDYLKDKHSVTNREMRYRIVDEVMSTRNSEPLASVIAAWLKYGFQKKRYLVHITGMAYWRTKSQSKE